MDVDMDWVGGAMVAADKMIFQFLSELATKKTDAGRAQAKSRRRELVWTEVGRTGQSAWTEVGRTGQSAWTDEGPTNLAMGRSGLKVAWTEGNGTGLTIACKDSFMAHPL